MRSGWRSENGYTVINASRSHFEKDWREKDMSDSTFTVYS
jgi:hypothetical protein